MMNKEEINGMAQIPNQENILYTSGYVKDLKDRIEDLQKENNKLKETIENVMTLTVCGDKKQIKNTAQYKLEDTQKRIDKAIEKIKELMQFPKGFGAEPLDEVWGDIILDILRGKDE